MVEDFSVIPVEKAADLVITTGGGHPLDATFYQSTKGLIGARPVCKKGGTVILVCGCDQGVGSENFCELVDACGDGETFDRKYSDPDNFILDQWAVQRYYQTVSKTGDVLVYSPGIDDKQLEPFGLARILDLQDTLDGLVGKHDHIIVIPQGPYVVGALGR